MINSNTILKTYWKRKSEEEWKEIKWYGWR